MLMHFFKRNYFILVLLILFIVLDSFIAIWDPVNKLPVFYKNDLEKTRYVHPEKEWDSVFFGNSSVIASFIEEKSGTQVINMGINYGKITDLDKMLSGDLIHVKQVILGLNFFNFMDDLPTDPAYIWHKKLYEPYIFFYRDSFKKYIMVNGNAIIKGEPVNVPEGGLYDKELYFGRIDKDELVKKIAEYQDKYGKLTINDFKENLKSMEFVIKYCKDRNIRVRAVWMPWNQTYKPPEYVDELKLKVNNMFAQANLEIIDWSEKYAPEYFHDLGHLNRERGAPLFTKEISEWLKK